MEKFEFSCSCGIKLFGRRWISQNPVANLLVMTGMLEHSGRYDYFGEKLNEIGISVHCIDYFGQGLNVTDGGTKYTSVPEDSFNKFDSICSQYMKTFDENLPRYLMGHSMGSFLALQFIENHSDLLSKAILMGSTGKIGASKIGYTLSKIVATKKRRDNESKFLSTLMLGGYNSKIKNPRTDFDWLAYDENDIDIYVADAQCGGIPTSGFCKEMLKGLCKIHQKKNLELIDKNLPILITSGCDDPVGNYGKGVKKLVKEFESIKLTKVSVKMYPNMRHEILQEKEKDLVIKDIKDFLKE